MDTNNAAGSTLNHPPCECGEAIAYWQGDESRTYACALCHAQLAKGQRVDVLNANGGVLCVGEITGKADARGFEVRTFGQGTFFIGREAIRNHG